MPEYWKKVNFGETNQNSLETEPTDRKKRQLSLPLSISHATLTGLEPATSAVTGRRANQLRHRANLLWNYFRTPNGIRTRAAAVKGRCPRPLDDGGLSLLATFKKYT